MSIKGAFATLCTKDEYLPGTLVVARCLKEVKSKYTLVVLATDTLSQNARDVLNSYGVRVRNIDPLMPTEGAHTLALHDIRFAQTWTKLRVFSLVEYDRVILMDSDMIVMRNMDELMELELPEGGIAAAHVCACNPRKLPHYPTDWEPENCAYTPLVHPTGISSPTQVTPRGPRPHGQLNSGLVILQPSSSAAESIAQFVRTSPLVETFAFPDQDLLSEYFRGRWRPLPYVYNALKTLRDIHKSLWRDEEVRCLHYIFPQKPWHVRPKAEVEGEDMYEAPNRWWWERFERLVAELELSDVRGKELVEASVAPPH
ncbi:nucleotide-diphospho-sugar transferase [Vararia minispora EC-137]|uniref:Nucleotide-diphospho-sugar transferase n=1 Tax=Vararia minispora EC-137 TaxID=1314806 RepID=A0ACB8QR16_9AGAM|nr:nucleotide-diphospho-sugar transferase [Vararia minispora EC-137]